jgi:hypothetical protein
MKVIILIYFILVYLTYGLFYFYFIIVDLFDLQISLMCDNEEGTKRYFFSFLYVLIILRIIIYLHTKIKFLV